MHTTVLSVSMFCYSYIMKFKYKPLFCRVKLDRIRRKAESFPQSFFLRDPALYSIWVLSLPVLCEEEQGIRFGIQQQRQVFTIYRYPNIRGNKFSLLRIEELINKNISMIFYSVKQKQKPPQFVWNLLKSSAAEP